MHKRGGPDTPVPLLCRVSCQQFCLQAKSYIFCVDFPDKLLYKLQCYFVCVFSPQNPQNLPQGGPARGGLGPPSVDEVRLGADFASFGSKKHKKITTPLCLLTSLNEESE